MNACGLIVEYNPFHYGHLYHIQKAKKTSNADCIIAIMSGPFLQRGEPAIIDKFHRTKAALASGVDLILELPYTYAVQNSDLFAKGAIQTLHEIGVSHICFGSESGMIDDFLTNYHHLKDHETFYTESLKKHLNLGFSFPKASMLAREDIGLQQEVDLSKPNNILGASYVQEILDHNLPIKPLTIQRKNNDYHQKEITHSIASATSIRKQLFLNNDISEDVIHTMPSSMKKQLELYKQTTSLWHQWEQYFSLLHYRVMTMSLQELASIHSVNEGLEHRIKKTAKNATSFKQWLTAIKTKRYTWTRLQRIFVHILTNTKKEDIASINHMKSVPYIRLLGMSDTGQKYLHQQKDNISIPIITQFSRNQHPMLSIEERASHAYYSILSHTQKKKLWKQEIQPPIF